MKNLTVLVTACGAQFMPGIANCLKDNGEREIRIIGTDMNKDDTVLQIVDAFYIVPSANDEKYVDRLLEICKKEKVDILLPFMSAELIPLLDRIDEFDSLGIKVSVSNRKSIEITNNKYKFYSFLKENNLFVPRFARVACSGDLLTACKKCGYPENAVCVKATELSGSRGIRIIDSSLSKFDILFKEKPNSFFTTLDELYSTLKEKETMPEMMAMEFLPGVEGSVDLLADDGEVLYIAYRESTVNLHSIPQSGVIKENNEAFEIAYKVVKALKISGNVDLDFKCDANGHPVLMEINPRIAATLSVFKAAGLNLPYLRIKQLLGEKLPKINAENGVKFKRRYLEMFCKE